MEDVDYGPEPVPFRIMSQQDYALHDVARTEYTDDPSCGEVGVGRVRLAKKKAGRYHHRQAVADP